MYLSKNESIRTITKILVCFWLLFFFFGLTLYVSLNSYGHVSMVSSPSHTFFLAKLDNAVNQYFVHIFSLVNDNKP